MSDREEEGLPEGLVPPLPGHERVDLARSHPRYTFRSGLSPWGAMLFGAVFLVVGLGLLGLAADWVAIDESSKEAPDFLIALIGVIFGCVGLMIIAMGLRERRRLKRLD